jgi:hypothetical protein
VDPRILIQNLVLYESNKIFLLLKNILAFIFGIFTSFFASGREKMNPYFRENESSEASGHRSDQAAFSSLGVFEGFLRHNFAKISP